MKEWKNRKEFETALRPILRGYPRPKVDQFLQSVWVAVRLGPMIPETTPLSGARAQYEDALRATSNYLEILSAVPFIVKRELPGEMLGSFMRAIERAGGPEAFFGAIDDNRRRRGKNPKRTPEETAPAAADHDPPAQSWPECSEEWQKFMAAEKEHEAEEERRQRRWETRLAGEDERDAVTRWTEDGEQAQWEFNKAKLEAFWSLERFRRDLTDLLECLPERRKPGRGRADPGKVLTEIAFAFKRILGETPITTEGGTYYSIAVIITGKKNPSRYVLPAVAAVRDAN